MAITDISVAGLESFQPAVDYKKSGRFAVISGKNFAWDASGVYSAYASRLVAGTTSIGKNPSIVQTLDIPDLSHSAVDGKIWRFNPASAGSPVGTWTNIYTHTPLVNANLSLIPYDYRKWTTGFLGARYACAYNYGMWKITSSGVWSRVTNSNLTGFPPDTDPVIAVCETNGRLCFVTATTFYWSAPGAVTLTPEIGGAGFQVIGERISGTVIALIPVANGAIIWTTSGALACEFIGGPTVFRFWVIKTQALPSSSFAITRLPDDSYVVLTRLGLFALNNFNQPQPIVPLFNEFLRDYLRMRPLEYGHVWYSINDNRLYVSFRPQTVIFSQTYALELTLDRWGSFNEYHIGIFNYGVSRGQLAYATDQGVVCYFLANSDVRKNKESPVAPGTLVGVNSEVLIGWMRATNLLGHADVVQELQEVLVNKKPLTEESIVQNYVDEERITGIAGDPTFDEGDILLLSTYGVLDEGQITAQEADYKYELEFVGDLFGDPAFDTVIPSLAKTTFNSDLWVRNLPAIYHRLRFKAVEVDDYFRVNSFDMTVAYSGNIS